MIDSPLSLWLNGDPAAGFPPPGEERQAVCDQAKRAVRAALSRGEVTRAEEILVWIKRAADQTQEGEVEACAQWCAGLFWLHREPRRALTHLEQARDFYRDAGRNSEAARVSVGIAGLFGQLGCFDAAQETIRFCLQHLPADYVDWMVVYINLSDIQGRCGEYAAMLESAHLAEQMALQRNAPVFVTMARINQGYAALFLERPELAQNCLAQALDLAHHEGFPDLAGRAAVALAHFAVDRGDLFPALGYLRQARSAFETAQIDMEQAEVAKEQSRIYERLNMPDQARDAAIQAARRFDRAGLPAESVQSWLAAAHIALSQGQPERARRCLEQIAGLHRQTSPLLQALARGYAAHPLLCTSRAALEEALNIADQVALEIAQLGIPGEQLEMELLAAQTAAALKHPSAAQRAARVAEQAFQLQLPELEYQARLQQAFGLKAAQAEPLLHRAAAITTHQRQQMPVEELKANLLSGRSDLYWRLIEAQLGRRQPAAAAQTLIEAKAGLWADLLALPPATLPGQSWLRARSELRYWQEFSPDEHAAEAVVIRQQKIAQAEAALIDLARSSPPSRCLQPVPAVQDVLRGLPEGTPVLEYVVQPHRIYACVLLAGHPPQWVPLGKTADVLRELRRWQVLQAELRHCSTPGQRLELAADQSHAAQGVLTQLYRELIAPLEDFLRPFQCLCCVPDHFLFDLPWAALYSPTGALGERYQIVLTPSSALGIIRRQIALAFEPTAPPLLLGYAGSPPLLYIQEELAAIQSSLPGAGCIFPARRSDAQWQRAPRLLHIAAHGQIRAAAPLLSGLELADGALLLSEVFQLNLRGTHLVTLSACESGALPERGGVMLALAGAFLLAGAENVLASLWPVEDQSTRIFMEYFYAGLQNGQGLPRAVQFAQQAVRADGYAHPYYWAAFQLLTGGLLENVFGG